MYELDKEYPKYRGSLMKIMALLYPFIIFFFLKYRFADKKYKYCTLMCCISMYLVILSSYFLHSFKLSRKSEDFHNLVQKIDHLVITISVFLIYLPFTLLINEDKAIYFYTFNIIIIFMYLIFLISCDPKETNGKFSNLIKSGQYAFNMIFFIFIISKEINTKQKIIWSLIYGSTIFSYYCYSKKPQYVEFKNGDFGYHETMHLCSITGFLLILLSAYLVHKEKYLNAPSLL
jgi:predicted membrane channel-forming protein YqfA (hemolysin III family)